MTDAEDMSDSTQTEDKRRRSDLPDRNARQAAWTVMLFVLVLSMFLFMVHEMLVTGILEAAAQNGEKGMVCGNGKAEAEP